METILVSSCLLGKNCKYNGGNNYNREVEKLGEKYRIISVCPEELGGLSTPRDPSEINNSRVITSKGIDVTDNFKLGARKTLNIALENNIKLAVLKEKSPSCGSFKIYDGSFSGRLILGKGMTSSLLLENNIEVLGENRVKKLK